MGHLDELKMTYWQHMYRAFGFAFRFFRAGSAVVIHAFFPNLLEHYASDELLRMVKELSVHKDRILVRFNTKWEQDPLKRTWRVLVNGEERLASDVHIEVACRSIIEDVEDQQGRVTKYHMLCHGKVNWDGDVATIVGF